MVSAKDVLKIYVKVTKQYKFWFILLFLCTVLASVVSVITPLFYKELFDTLAASNTPSEAVPELVKILLIILGLNGLSWLFYRAGSFFDAAFHARMYTAVKQFCFNYLIKHSYSFFANNFGGSLVQKLSRLARSFDRVTDRVLWDLIPMVVRVTGITIALWFLNKIIAIVLIVWILLFLILHLKLSAWKLKYDEIRAEKDSKTTAVLADSITNHNTIQLFSGFDQEISRYENVTKDHAKAMLKAENIALIIEAIQTIFFVLIEFALIYLAIRFWGFGWITLGTIILLQTYLGNIISRLWDFGRVIRDVYEGIGDAKEMVAILNLQHEIQDLSGSKNLIVNKGRIIFENVKFSFPSQKQVLRGLSLEIKSGEKIALIGPSGAGKSTLIKLLLRFYDLKEGKILVDGQEITKVTQESLRNNISLVPQDPILFHRTLLENIRYGRKGATDEEVYKAARLAHCDEFIKKLPNGYETYVGERGIKLSGGERQRVAIARAMLKNAPILILDEATSSLDSHSEKLIQDALEKLMKGKTVIVIAHRLSTIKKMDRIIVIDKGKVTETGTHKELLRRNSSLYRMLWELQAGGFLAKEK